MTTARQDAITKRTEAISARVNAKSAAYTAKGDTLTIDEIAEIDAAHPIPPRKKPSNGTGTRNQEAIEQAEAGEFDKPTIGDVVRDTVEGYTERKQRRDDDLKANNEALMKRLAKRDEHERIMQSPGYEPDTEQPAPTPNPVCVAVLSFDTGPDRVMVMQSPQHFEQIVDRFSDTGRFVYGNDMQGGRWGFRLNTLRQWTCKVITPPPTNRERIEAAYDAADKPPTITVADVDAAFDKAVGKQAREDRGLMP